jgi:hypothetical protein
LVEPGEVRFFVGNPFLDRLPGWFYRLEGLDVEGWSGRRRNVDDALPKPVKTEEEFNLLRAFHGTTNLDLGSLTERFQTRFQLIRLQPPSNEVLAAFLARRWGAPISTTRMIAAGAAGNVRAAMADLEMWLG